jgi:hypothetical protein
MQLFIFADPPNGVRITKSGGDSIGDGVDISHFERRKTED